MDRTQGNKRLSCTKVSTGPDRNLERRLGLVKLSAGGEDTLLGITKQLVNSELTRLRQTFGGEGFTIGISTMMRMNRPAARWLTPVVGVLMPVAACNPTPTEAPIHTYVSTDNEESFFTDGARYHLGAYLFADPSKVMEGKPQLVLDGGCYQADIVAFARFNAAEVRCGTYSIRRIIGTRGPIEAYEVNCLPNTRCPAQTWRWPAARYYLDNSGALLGFELLPGSRDQLLFVRTSASGLIVRQNGRSSPTATMSRTG